jgi:hypothetical protein
MGFTGLMSNGMDPDTLFNESVNGFIMGGAVGLASVPASSGSPLANNQEQAFQMGFLLDTTSPVISIETGLIQPYFNGALPSLLKDEIHGLFMGTGDQDNYILVAITPNYGNPGMLILREDNGVIVSDFYPLGSILTENLTLYLEVDPSSGTVQPKYKRTSDAQSIAVGAPIPLGGKILSNIKAGVATAAGILASSRSGKPFAATWDFLKLATPSAPPSGPSTWRVNTGGSDVLEGGQLWSGDVQFSDTDPAAPSQTYTSNTTIGNTTVPTIYQSERYGKSFNYKMPLPNGTYTVNLHFAEIYWNNPGSRIFSVSIENEQQKLTNFDILSETSPKEALIKPFTINITDGELTILFTAVTDMAKISAIEVFPLSAPPPPPPPPPSVPTIRINSGGPSFTLNGQEWEADKYVGAGTSYTYSSSVAVANTSIGSLYQSERYGNSFGYSIPVASGSYQVTLHFAEIYWTSSGSRIFNVNIENGQGILSNYDIFSLAGKNGALSEHFKVNVEDGQLNISFTTVKDNAKISGIEISPIVQTASIEKPPYNLTLQATPIEVKLMPNPFNNRFLLNMQGGNGEKVDIKVVHTSGQVMEVIQNVQPSHTLTLGDAYPPGMYFIEIRQGGDRVITGIIKQ